MKFVSSFEIRKNSRFYSKFLKFVKCEFFKLRHELTLYGVQLSRLETNFDDVLRRTNDSDCVGDPAAHGAGWMVARMQAAVE